MSCLLDMLGFLNSYFWCGLRGTILYWGGLVFVVFLFALSWVVWFNWWCHFCTLFLTCVIYQLGLVPRQRFRDKKGNSRKIPHLQQMKIQKANMLDSVVEQILHKVMNNIYLVLSKRMLFQGQYFSIFVFTVSLLEITVYGAAFCANRRQIELQMEEKMLTLMPLHCFMETWPTTNLCWPDQEAGNVQLLWDVVTWNIGG